MMHGQKNMKPVRCSLLALTLKM